ncbi:protein C19orf12 homolog [Lycorma delicatula]|uniref:protein C19orf12 homolog n=1 Tax=Lycorma delicatula TaxID=130591 RepID=UPI003F51AC20
MPVNQHEIIGVLAQLAEEREIKVAVTESLKGAALVGAATFIGGILLGPLGLAAGGIAGGITAAASSKNSFRPVAKVILEDMSPKQQALLASRVHNILREFNVTDLVLLLPIIQGNARLGEAVMSALLGFIQSEMNLRLM